MEMEDGNKQQKGGSPDIDFLSENMEDSNSNSYPNKMCDPEMDSNNESADQEEEDGNKAFDIYGDLDISGDLQQGSSQSETDRDTTVENAVNDLDLYDEILTEEDAQQKQSYEEKCRQFELARQQIEKLEAENRKLKEDLSKQTLVSKNVQKNMSSLIVTARGEISRKDREINNLRKRHNFPRGNSYRTPGNLTGDNRPSKSSVGHPSTGKMEDSGSDVSDSLFSRSKEATTGGSTDKKLDSNCVTNDSPTHSNRHHKENQDIDVFGRSRLRDNDSESDKEYYKDRDRRNKRDSVHDNNSKSSEKRKSSKQCKEVPVNGRLRTEFRNENKHERENEKKANVGESKGHIRRSDKQESRKESHEKRRDVITNDKRTNDSSETKDAKQRSERQVKVHDVQNVSNEDRLKIVERGDRNKDTLLDPKPKQNNRTKDELKSSDRKDSNKRSDKKKQEEDTRKPETEVGGKSDTESRVEKNKMHDPRKSTHSEHKHDANHKHSNQRKEVIPDKTPKADKTSALKVIDLREKLKQKRALTKSVSPIKSDSSKIPTEKYNFFESSKQKDKQPDAKTGLKQLRKPNITLKSNGNADIGSKDTEILKDREFLESLKSGVRHNKPENMSQDSKCADQPHRTATDLANRSDKADNLDASCERTILDGYDLHSVRISSLENPALNNELIEKDMSHEIEKCSELAAFSASQEDIVIDFGFQDDNIDSDLKESINDRNSKISQLPTTQRLLELDNSDNENCLDTVKHMTSVENIENPTNNDDSQTENGQMSDKRNSMDAVMHESINVQSNTETSSLSVENYPHVISVSNEKPSKSERRRSSEKKRRKSFRGVTSETISTVTSVDISSSVEDFVRNLRRESEKADNENNKTKPCDMLEDATVSVQHGDIVSIPDKEIKSLETEPTELKSRKTICSKEGCQIKVSHLHPKSEQNLTSPISKLHDTSEGLLQTEGKESKESCIENIKNQDNQKACDSDTLNPEVGEIKPKENISNQSTNCSEEMTTIEMNPKSNDSEEYDLTDKPGVKLNPQENPKQSSENDSLPVDIEDELPLQESIVEGNEITYLNDEASKADLDKGLADPITPSIKPSDNNTRDESSDSDEDSDYTGTGSGSSYSSYDSSDGEESYSSESHRSGSGYSSYGSCDSDSEEPLTKDLNIKSNCSFDSAPMEVTVEKIDSVKTLDLKTESSTERMSPVCSDITSQSNQYLRRKENVSEEIVTNTCDVSRSNEQFTGLKQKDSDVIQEDSVTNKLAEKPETTKGPSKPDKISTTVSNPDKKIIPGVERSSQLNKISPIRSIKERSFLLDSLLCGIKSVVDQKQKDEKRLSHLLSKVETAKESHATINNVPQQNMIVGHHSQKEEDHVKQFSRTQNHSNKRVVDSTTDAKQSGDNEKMFKSTSPDAKDEHSLKDDVIMDEKTFLDQNSIQKKCSDVNVNVMKGTNSNVKDTIERETAPGHDKDEGEIQGDHALETSIFGSTLSLSSDDSAVSDSESCSGSSSGSYSSSGSSGSCSTCDSSDSESIVDPTENQNGDSTSKVSIVETKISNPDTSQKKLNDILNERDISSDRGDPKVHKSVFHNNTSGRECNILESCVPVVSDKEPIVLESCAPVVSDKKTLILKSCPPVVSDKKPLILKSVVSDKNKHSRLEEIPAQVTSHTHDKQSDVLDTCPSISNHNSNELESHAPDIQKKDKARSTHLKADKPCKRNKADKSSKSTAKGNSSCPVISKDLPIGTIHSPLVPGSEYLIEDEMPKFLSDTLELKKLTNSTLEVKKLTNNKKQKSKSDTLLRPSLSSTSTSPNNKCKLGLDPFTNKTRKTEEKKGLDTNTLTTVDREKKSTKIDNSAGNNIKSHKGSSRCKEKMLSTKDSSETKETASEDEISKSTIIHDRVGSLLKNSKEWNSCENHDKQIKSHDKMKASKSSTKKSATLTTSTRGKDSKGSKKILSTDMSSDKIKPQSKCHVKTSRSDNSVSGSILRLVSKSNENIKEKSDRKSNEKAKLASPKKRLTKSLSKDNTSYRSSAENVSKYNGKKGTRLKFEHDALPELRDPASELTANIAKIAEYNNRVQERKKSLGNTNTSKQRKSFPLSSNLLKEKSAKSKAAISSDTGTSDEEQSIRVKDSFRIKKKSQQEEDQHANGVVSTGSEKHVHKSKQDEKKRPTDSIPITNSQTNVHHKKVDKMNSVGTIKPETQSFECALENYESHIVKSNKTSKLKRDVTNRKALDEKGSKTNTKKSDAPSGLVSDESNIKSSSSVKKPNISELPEKINLSAFKDRRKETTLSCKSSGNIVKENCRQTGVKKTKCDDVVVESKTTLKEDYCNDDADDKFRSDSESDCRTNSSESDSDENIVKAIFGSSDSSGGLRKKSAGSGIISKHVDTNTIEMEKIPEVITNLDEKLKQLYSIGRKTSESDTNSRAKPVISHKQQTTSNAYDRRPPEHGQKTSESARKSSSKKSLETNTSGSKESDKVRDPINENKRKLMETNQTTKDEFTRKTPIKTGTKSISTPNTVQISSSDKTNNRQLSDQISREKPTARVLEVKQTDSNTHTKSVPVLKSVSPKENVNKGMTFHNEGKIVELDSHKNKFRGSSSKSVTDYILDDAEVFDAVDYDDDLSLCLDESGRSNSDKDVNTANGNLHKGVDSMQARGEFATPGSEHHSSEEGELSSDYDTDKDDVHVERNTSDFGSVRNKSKTIGRHDTELGGNEKRSFSPIKFPSSTGQSSSQYVNNEGGSCGCATINCVHKRGSEVKRKRIQSESDSGDDETRPAYSSAKKSHHEGKGRNISRARKAIAINSPVIRRHRSRSRSPVVKRHRRSRSPKHHISRRSCSISPRRHSKSAKSSLVSRTSLGSKRRRSSSRSHERIRETGRPHKDRSINERREKRHIINSASSSDDDDRYRSPIRGSGMKRRHHHIHRRSDSRNRRYHSPISDHRRDHSTRKDDSDSETLHVSSKHSSKKHTHGSSSRKKEVPRKEKQETLSRKDISLYKRAREEKRFSGHKRKYASSSSDEYVLVKKSELKRRRSVRSISPTFSDSGDCTDDDENTISNSQRKNSSEKENYSIPLRKRQLTSGHE